MSDPKSLILYVSRGPTQGSGPVHCDGTTVYVRGVRFDGDVSAALDAADKTLLPGETVLNTIPL